MLVLSRKVGEKIIINDNIEVIIHSIDRGKVRLGIVAPKDVLIFRQELQDRINAGVPKPKAT